MDQSAPTPGATRYQVTIGARTLVVELSEGEGGALIARIDGGAELPVRLTGRAGDGLLTLLAGGRSMTALVGEAEDGRAVVVDGEQIDAVVRDERAARLASATAAGRKGVVESTIKAPMPGLVVTVHVEPGQQVTKGEALVVLSAMKMQNELTARDDATIREVHVQAGQTVDQGQVLVTFA